MVDLLQKAIQLLGEHKTIMRAERIAMSIANTCLQLTPNNEMRHRDVVHLIGSLVAKTQAGEHLVVAERIEARVQ